MNLYFCTYCGQVDTDPHEDYERSLQCGSCSYVGYLEEMDLAWASEALRSLTKGVNNEALVEALEQYLDVLSTNADQAAVWHDAYVRLQREVAA